jgi:hypothetical protein
MKSKELEGESMEEPWESFPPKIHPLSWLNLQISKKGVKGGRKEERGC